MNIRKAESRDAQAIAEVQVESWRTTYKDIVPQKFLDGLSVEDRKKVWEKVIALHFVFVAENVQERVIGFAAGGEERTKNYPEYTGELYAIYLLEHIQGEGLGRQLFNRVVSVLQEQKHSSMLIWALSENPACRFYEKMGGREVDRVMTKIGGKPLEETAFGWKFGE